MYQTAQFFIWSVACHRGVNCCRVPDLNDIAQYKLFRSSHSQQHCLNHLYTVKSRSLSAMRLRTQGTISFSR